MLNEMQKDIEFENEQYNRAMKAFFRNPIDDWDPERYFTPTERMKSIIELAIANDKNLEIILERGYASEFELELALRELDIKFIKDKSCFDGNGHALIERIKYHNERMKKQPMERNM